MLATLVKWTVGSALLAGLLWRSASAQPAIALALLLAIWTVAIGVLIYLNLAERFLWIPVLLALAGVFGSVLAFAIPANITLAADVTTLVLFVVSLEVLKQRRASLVFARQRARLPGS